MTTTYMILTILFIIIAVAMILIILVQRPQGGGLAGAFGGAGGGGTESVFGGRVGDALTYMTVGAFSIYLVLAIALNLIDSSPAAAQPLVPEAVAPADGEFNPDDVFIAPPADGEPSSGATFVPTPAPSDDVVVDPETPLDPDVPVDPDQNETP